jgi:hypothetical protein
MLHNSLFSGNATAWVVLRKSILANSTKPFSWQQHQLGIANQFHIDFYVRQRLLFHIDFYLRQQGNKVIEKGLTVLKIMIIFYRLMIEIFTS